MATMTIKTVQDAPRPWGPSYPDGASACVQFEDGSVGEVGSKIGAPVQKHIDALKGLIGKPGEFVLEERKEYMGIKQWKIKEYPGKAQPQGGGGFGGGGGGGRAPYVPAFHQTQEGMAYEQERMDRRTAIMQAVIFANQAATTVIPPEPAHQRMDLVLAAADAIYEWLRSNVPAEKAPASHAVGLADKPAPHQKSVFEDYLEALAGYDKVLAVVKLAENVQIAYSNKILEEHERKKIDLLMVKKAINISKSKEGFEATDKLIQSLHKQHRLTDIEHSWHCSRLSDAMAEWDSVNQLDQRFQK